MTEIFLSFGDLFSATAYAELREKVDAQPNLVYEQILRRLHLSVGASAVDVIHAWLEIDRCAAAYHARVAPFTAVLCPTSTISPPVIADQWKTTPKPMPRRSGEFRSTPGPGTSCGCAP